MCNQLIMLAELDERRYIAQCEHGTIHVGWDMITLHLTRSYFLELAKAIQYPLPHDEQVLAQTSWFRLTRNKRKHLSLRIGQAELHLLPQDFQFLSQMMLRSCAVVEARQLNTRSPLTLYLAPPPSIKDAFMN
jgi:hypothetical protein